MAKLSCLFKLLPWRKAEEFQESIEEEDDEVADVGRHEQGPLSREMGVRHLRRLHGALHQPRWVLLSGFFVIIEIEEIPNSIGSNSLLLGLESV